MLSRIVATAVFAIIGLVNAQDSPTTPSICATGCVSGVISNAAAIGCPNGDTTCVCGKTESFLDGIRDCITGACAADGPDVQIPLAEAYGKDICAKSNPAPPVPPTSSTAAPPPEPTPAEATSSTSPTVPASTTTPVPSPESDSQSTAASTATSTAASTAEESTATGSSAGSNTPTTAPASPLTTSASASASSLSATSESTSASSSATTSGASQPAATSGTSTATSGLSTAAKAGIGAGVGAAALAAAIIAACMCLRRRQRNKTADRVRNYQISEPMSSTDHQFANDIGRAESALPKPIVTAQRVHVDSTAMPNSPTSVYSNSSDLESHARRYEDMLPRTQPRTMI